MQIPNTKPEVGHEPQQASQATEKDERVFGGWGDRIHCRCLTHPTSRSKPKSTAPITECPAFRLEFFTRNQQAVYWVVIR